MSHLTLLLRMSFVSMALLITLNVSRPAQACGQCVDYSGTSNAIGSGPDCDSAQIDATTQLNNSGYPACSQSGFDGPCRVHTYVATACWWDGSQYEIEMERDYGCHPELC